MTITLDDYLFCYSDVIGKQTELTIKAIQKFTSERILAEFEHTTGTIRLGVGEEFVTAILSHELMHKVLNEVLEGEEAIKANWSYDNLRNEIDFWLNPHLIFAKQYRKPK